MNRQASNITTCKHPCVECGFVRGGKQGTLKLPMIEYIQKGIIFPCHLELKAVTGSENTGIEIYMKEVDEIRICRGLIESMYISGVEPKNSRIAKLYDEVKDSLHDDIMKLDEVVEYHLGVKEWKIK